MPRDQRTPSAYRGAARTARCTRSRSELTRANSISLHGRSRTARLIFCTLIPRSLGTLVIARTLSFGDRKASRENHDAPPLSTADSTRARRPCGGQPAPRPRRHHTPREPRPWRLRAAKPCPRRQRRHPGADATQGGAERSRNATCTEHPRFETERPRAYGVHEIRTMSNVWA